MQPRRATPRQPVVAKARAIAPRNHVRISFGLIVAAGLVGALLAGAGKHVKFRPEVDASALSATLGGKPVRIGGRWATMVEKRLSSMNSANSALIKKSPAR